MDYFTGNQGPRIDQMKALFTFKDVSEKTQNHLKTVYANLMGCTVICALGMYMNAYTIL